MGGNGHGFKRNIHDISNSPFRTKFEDDLVKYGGNSGLGVISDTEDQPLLIASRHGSYAIVTVGRVENLDALARQTLVHGCRFLNFSQSKSELDLAARRAVKALEGDASAHLDDYADPSTDRYQAMVDWIRGNLGLTTLQYQKLDDMVAAIGLPREKLCTYCWNGESA